MSLPPSTDRNLSRGLEWRLLLLRRSSEILGRGVFPGDHLLGRGDVLLPLGHPQISMATKTSNVANVVSMLKEPAGIQKNLVKCIVTCLDML